MNTQEQLRQAFNDLERGTFLQQTRRTSDSVADCEPLPNVLRLFQFVNHGHCIVLN